ncbi:transcription factor mef2A-like [Hermetia illucens]|uniref:transcription factor mef2A-like n=1 Tax=Hermetia illucens TaxID=343691 RepID=UPI0018CC32AF|nr:transcription factor mef2A-like [Hermetia illucens]
MVDPQLPLELPFQELIKEARRLPVYTGHSSEYSLNTWIDEVNTLLALTQPGNEQSYIFRLILHRIQGAARDAIQKVSEQNWQNIKAALIFTFGSLIPEYKAYLLEIRNCTTLNQAYSILSEVRQNIDNDNQPRNNNNNYHNNPRNSHRNNQNQRNNNNRPSHNYNNNHRQTDNRQNFNQNPRYNNYRFNNRNNNNRPNNYNNQNNHNSQNQNRQQHHYHQNNRTESMQVDNSNQYRRNNYNQNQVQEPMDKRRPFLFYSIQDLLHQV